MDGKPAAASRPSPRTSPLAIWRVALATRLPWNLEIEFLLKHAELNNRISKEDPSCRTYLPYLTILLRLTSCQPSWMARLKRPHLRPFKFQWGPLKPRKLSRPCLVDDCLVSFLTSASRTGLETQQSKFVSSVLRTNIWTNHFSGRGKHCIALHMAASQRNHDQNSDPQPSKTCWSRLIPVMFETLKGRLTAVLSLLLLFPLCHINLPARLCKSSTSSVSGSTFGEKPSSTGQRPSATPFPSAPGKPLAPWSLGGAHGAAPRFWPCQTAASALAIDFL